MDEAMLKDIARAGKGFELPLQGTRTIDSLYDQGIANLPKTESAIRQFQRYHERFQWPLAIALILLTTEIFLPERKRRRSSKTEPEGSALPAMTGTAVFLLLVSGLAAHGSPSDALREYNNGEYKDAFRDYNKLLDNARDPRLHFNAGAAAYQNQDLDSAKREFSESLSSPDLPLQQRSYYNLGNTFYRIGQQLPDADKKQEAWENALKQYESALKLNGKDGDASYNMNFVKKQLELLKQQQQQKQKQSKDKSDKNDSNDKDQKNKDQQQQQSQDQKNQDQKNQDKDQQDSKQQQNEKNQQGQQNKSDQNSKGDKSDQSKNKQQQQQQQAQKDKDKQEQSQAASQPEDKSKSEAEQEAAAMAAGEMTPQQAQQLLDSQKGSDQVLRLAPPNKNTLKNRSFKNW